MRRIARGGEGAGQERGPLQAPRRADTGRHLRAGTHRLRHPEGHNVHSVRGYARLSPERDTRRGALAQGAASRRQRGCSPKSSGPTRPASPTGSSTVRSPATGGWCGYDEATLIRDEEGNSLYWLGVQYDITEQKRTEEEFRKSEERFRATFEQAAVGIVQVGLDGGWLRVNDKFCDIVGYEREELGTVSVFQLISPRTSRETSTGASGCLRGSSGTIPRRSSSSARAEARLDQPDRLPGARRRG